MIIQTQQCNLDYMGYAVSPVGATTGVICGMPYGGVSFLCNRYLDEYITILDCDYDWLFGIQILRNH